MYLRCGHEENILCTLFFLFVMCYVRVHIINFNIKWYFNWKQETLKMEAWDLKEVTLATLKLILLHWNFNSGKTIRFIIFAFRYSGILWADAAWWYEVHPTENCRDDQDSEQMGSEWRSHHAHIRQQWREYYQFLSNCKN